jgi:signal transduction histidine kinase
VIARVTAVLNPLRIGWLAVGLIVSVGTLAWVAYRATGEWQRSASLLAQRRADAAADLLVTAITRDMRGVQTSVLSSLRFDEVRPNPILELNGVGSALARYPYPEVFFAGRGAPLPESLTFYTRAERPAPWLQGAASGPARFPVVLATDTAVSQTLLQRIRQDVTDGRRFATFDVALQGVDYQAVALLSYADAGREHLDAVVGFVVNLDWMRQHYFQELAGQVVLIRGADTGLALAIVDGQAATVAGETADGPSSSRSFPLLFFSPSLIALNPPPDLKRVSWTARATVSGDRALTAAQRGARRTLAVAAVSTLTLAIGFALAVGAARASAQLVIMRSDFVSAVTHELKTPIATIRAISETLASGRASDAEISRDLAQVSVHEAKRLTRLIDNLLAYARITDVTEAYSFEPVEISIIVREILKEFSSQLTAAGFTVNVEVPPGLPLVRADRSSILLALGNLVDNAIRYSAVVRRLTIAAHPTGDAVVIEVTDGGVGIPAHEIQHVTRKFFRGNGAVSGGSGLGLSITHRIVSDHGGALSIRSEVGAGTTVGISLPAAVVDDEETHTHR